jgi:hypothetical protein
MTEAQAVSPVAGRSNDKIDCIPVRRCDLFHISLHDSVCRRVRIRLCRTKDDRYRREIGAFEAIVVVPMAQTYLIA